MKNSMLVIQVLVCFSVSSSYAMESHVTGLFSNILAEHVEVYVGTELYTKVFPGREITMRDIDTFSVYIPSRRETQNISLEKYFYSYIYYNDSISKPQLWCIEHIQYSGTPINCETGEKQPISKKMRTFLDEKYELIKQYNNER